MSMFIARTGDRELTALRGDRELIALKGDRELLAAHEGGVPTTDLPSGDREL